jgi:hypothetical protein
MQHKSPAFPPVSFPPPKSDLWFSLNNALNATVPAEHITIIVDAIDRLIQAKIDGKA